MKPGKPQGRTLRAGIGWARGEHPIKGTPQTDKKISPRARNPTT